MNDLYLVYVKSMDSMTVECLKYQNNFRTEIQISCDYICIGPNNSIATQLTVRKSLSTRTYKYVFYFILCEIYLTIWSASMRGQRLWLNDKIGWLWPKFAHTFLYNMLTSNFMTNIWSNPSPISQIVRQTRSLWDNRFRK